MVTRVEAIEGMKLSWPGFADPLAIGVKQLQALQDLAGADGAKKLALLASVHSFNVLLTASATVCQRSLTEGDAEIDLITDVGGRLIYRCKHDPSHEWSLDGNIIK
jgi:hypothetical protein